MEAKVTVAISIVSTTVALGSLIVTVANQRRLRTAERAMRDRDRGLADVWLGGLLAVGRRLPVHSLFEDGQAGEFMRRELGEGLIALAEYIAGAPDYVKVGRPGCLQSSLKAQAEVRNAQDILKRYVQPGVGESFTYVSDDPRWRIADVMQRIHGHFRCIAAEMSDSRYLDRQTRDFELREAHFSEITLRLVTGPQR